MIEKIKNTFKEKAACKSRIRGFSLIELTVVVTVMSILMSVILWNYHGSINSASVGNAMRETRLVLREAQQWSTGSRIFPSGAPASDTDRYDRGFGVYFDISEPNIIRLYGGEDTSSIDYDSGNVVKTATWFDGAYIKSMCANTEANCTPVSTLEIFYRRPALEPTIHGDGNSTDLAYARIQIAADTGSVSEQWLIIYNSGRIESLATSP